MVPRVGSGHIITALTRLSPSCSHHVRVYLLQCRGRNRRILQTNFSHAHELDGLYVSYLLFNRNPDIFSIKCPIEKMGQAQVL